MILIVCVKVRVTVIRYKGQMDRKGKKDLKDTIVHSYPNKTRFSSKTNNLNFD